MLHIFGEGGGEEWNHHILMEKGKRFRVGSGLQYALDSRRLCVNKSRGHTNISCICCCFHEDTLHLAGNESKAMPGLHWKGVGHMQVSILLYQGINLKNGLSGGGGVCCCFWGSGLPFGCFGLLWSQSLGCPIWSLPLAVYTGSHRSCS